MYWLVARCSVAHRKATAALACFFDALDAGGGVSLTIGETDEAGAGYSFDWLRLLPSGDALTGGGSGDDLCDYSNSVRHRSGLAALAAPCAEQTDTYAAAQCIKNAMGDAPSVTTCKPSEEICGDGE